MVLRYFVSLFSDAEINIPYFNRVLNFSGTIMVQFKANYRKTKQSILIEITKLMGVVWYKCSRNSEYINIVKTMEFEYNC